MSLCILVNQKHKGIVFFEWSTCRFSWIKTWNPCAKPDFNWTPVYYAFVRKVETVSNNECEIGNGYGQATVFHTPWTLCKWQFVCSSLLFQLIIVRWYFGWTNFVDRYWAAMKCRLILTICKTDSVHCHFCISTKLK